VGASYGVGNEEVLKAAAALKPGELSGIIETPRGLHLLQVEPKLEAANLEAFGRRYVAHKLYVHAAGDEQVKAFGEELIRRTKAGAKLEDALQAQLAQLLPPAQKPLGAGTAPESPALTALDRPRIEISSPFPSSGNPVPQVTPKEPLAARAFELKTADEVWQTPIQTSEGALVIQLKEKNPASRADFDKNKEELLGPMRASKANEALAYYIADLRKKAGEKLKVDARFGEEAKSSRDDE